MATTPKSLKPDLGSLRISDTKRNAARSSRRWLWLILGVLALILLAAAASAFRDRKAEVEVAPARKPVSGPAGVLNASGYITPRRRATIAATSCAMSLWIKGSPPGMDTIGAPHSSTARKHSSGVSCILSTCAGY